MREIKFRVYLDKMYYQDEYVEYDTNLIGIDFLNKTVTFAAYTDGEEVDNLEKYSFDENDFLYKKDLKIMQYTGLKNKNNKEIYEGDIVTLHNSRYKVIFNMEQARFVLRDDKFEMEIPFTNNNNERMEIIGNIYENPELMEEVR
ncbi:MAG: YopX family protein [Fusobacterium periodonticum]|nr:YopX family protein [Fusobacterium periodonticum]